MTNKAVVSGELLLPQKRDPLADRTAFDVLAAGNVAGAGPALEEIATQTMQEQTEAGQATKQAAQVALAEMQKTVEGAKKLQEYNLSTTTSSRQQIDIAEAALSRVDAINNSLLLQFAEPFVGIFNPEFDRRKLMKRTDVALKTAALAEKRRETYENDFAASQRVSAAKINEARAGAAVEDVDVQNLQALTGTAKQAYDNIRTQLKQQIDVSTEAELIELERQNKITPREREAEFIKRSSESLALQSQVLASQMQKMQATAAQIGTLTTEQIDAELADEKSRFPRQYLIEAKNEREQAASAASARQEQRKLLLLERAVREGNPDLLKDTPELLAEFARMYTLKQAGDKEAMNKLTAARMTHEKTYALHEFGMLSPDEQQSKINSAVKAKQNFVTVDGIKIPLDEAIELQAKDQTAVFSLSMLGFQEELIKKQEQQVEAAAAGIANETKKLFGQTSQAPPPGIADTPTTQLLNSANELVTNTSVPEIERQELRAQIAAYEAATKTLGETGQGNNVRLSALDNMIKTLEKMHTTQKARQSVANEALFGDEVAKFWTANPDMPLPGTLVKKAWPNLLDAQQYNPEQLKTLGVRDFFKDVLSHGNAKLIEITAGLPTEEVLLLGKKDRTPEQQARAQRAKENLASMLNTPDAQNEALAKFTTETATATLDVATGMSATNMLAQWFVDGRHEKNANPRLVELARNTLQMAGNDPLEAAKLYIDTVVGETSRNENRLRHPANWKSDWRFSGRRIAAMTGDDLATAITGVVYMSLEPEKFNQFVHGVRQNITATEANYTPQNQLESMILQGMFGDRDVAREITSELQTRVIQLVQPYLTTTEAAKLTPQVSPVNSLQQLLQLIPHQGK